MKFEMLDPQTTMLHEMLVDRAGCGHIAIEYDYSQLPWQACQIWCSICVRLYKEESGR